MGFLLWLAEGLMRSLLPQVIDAITAQRHERAVARLAREIERDIGPLISISTDVCDETVAVLGQAGALRYTRECVAARPDLAAALSLLSDLVLHASATLRRGRHSAVNRAWDLLLRHLSDQQANDLCRTGSFMVRGGETGLWYRIHKGSTSNIEVLNEGRAMERLCVVPEGVDALGDILLAQKIAFECYESVALGKAYRSAIVRYGTHEEELPNGGPIAGGAALQYDAALRYAVQRSIEIGDPVCGIDPSGAAGD